MSEVDPIEKQARENVSNLGLGASAAFYLALVDEIRRLRSQLSSVQLRAFGYVDPYEANEQARENVLAKGFNPHGSLDERMAFYDAVDAEILRLRSGYGVDAAEKRVVSTPEVGVGQVPKNDRPPLKSVAESGR